MRRFAAGVVVAALAMTAMTPALASAAAPSKTEMLKEQIASQDMIGRFLGLPSNKKQWIKSLSFGKVQKASATNRRIPVTVKTSGGSSVSGWIVVKKYGRVWYFYSITRGSTAKGISNVAIPAGITSSAIGNCIKEQFWHRWLMLGLVTGGYKKVTVLSRSHNWNTMGVNLKLYGGTRHWIYERFTAYRKTAANGKRYWFLCTLK